MPLQIRRGTEAERQIMASPPAQGELIWITDDKKLFIGDGTTLARNLTPVTGYDDAEAADAAAAMITSGSHDYINFTYNAGARTMDTVVDLSDYDGSIRATVFEGSLVAEDSTELVNAIDGSINLDGTVKGHIVPNSDEAYDLGSNSNRFRDIYLSGSSIDLGGSVITRNSAGGINFPANSTVNGAPLEPTGGVGGTLNVDIAGDDSTILVNTSTNTLTGSFIGDIKGSLFGDDSTLLVDAIDNKVSTGPITLEGRNIIVEDNNFINIQGSSGNKVEDVNVISQSLNVIGDGITQDINDQTTLIVSASRGTVNNPQDVQTGDLLGSVVFSGYDSGVYNPKGAISFTIDTQTGTENLPGKLLLTPADFDGNLTPRVSVDSRGTVEAPVFKATSFANDTERDAYIISPQAGMMIFNLRDDSTGVPVFQGYDGNVWVDLH